MRQHGSVSLWIGWAASENTLDDYVRETYPPGDDGPISAFARDFNIRFYDEGFREAEFIPDAVSSLRELLAGFSYAEVIAPRLASLHARSLPSDASAVVLLYNFEYAGDVREHRSSSVHVRYMGATRYDR
jgi:hypothetical protein